MKGCCIIRFVAFLIVCSFLSSCGKTKLGSIYGTVTDYATGDPVGNANVRLNPRGETTLTGSDGTFQFNDLVDGSYSLSLSMSGYVDLDDDYTILIENGNSVRRDVQLYQTYASYTITVNGVETDVIDFGSDSGFNKISVLMTNTGTESFYVYAGLIDESHNWIDTTIIGGSGGYLYPGNARVLGIEIYRQKLQSGENVGYIYLNYAGISKTLTIKATK